MVVGYLGASTFALGLARLLQGEGAVLPALAFVLAGGALAINAWRSGYRALDGTGIAAAPVDGQARAGIRSASGLTTLVGAPEA